MNPTPFLHYSHGAAEARSSAAERPLALVEIVLTVGLIAVLAAGVR
jgi:hypothetical protein